MNRPLIGSGVTLLAVSAWLAFDAFATPTIQRKWFNTYPEACGFLVAAANECSLCHTLLPNGDPTALFKHNNRYGMAIAANGYDIKATEPCRDGLLDDVECVEGQVSLNQGVDNSYRGGCPSLVWPRPDRIRRVG
jgi:hypothetical protein